MVCGHWQALAAGQAPGMCWCWSHDAADAMHLDDWSPAWIPSLKWLAAVRMMRTTYALTPYSGRDGRAMRGGGRRQLQLVDGQPPATRLAPGADIGYLPWLYLITGAGQTISSCNLSCSCCACGAARLSGGMARLDRQTGNETRKFRETFFAVGTHPNLKKNSRNSGTYKAR